MIISATTLNAEQSDAVPKMTQEQALFFWVVTKWADGNCPKNTLTPLHYMLASAIGQKAPPDQLVAAERLYLQPFLASYKSVADACRSVLLYED
jgi:hypothetical protein